jgi:hypothetical protein
VNEPGKSGPSLPAWWPTFLGMNGLLMAWWEVVYDHFDRPWIVVLVGVLCAGMPAQLIVAFVEWFAGRRNGGHSA